jgi:nucleotide-binding universal stress UspA family protein
LFEKILVAVDGSKPALDALDIALTIAGNCKATEVQLVHVAHSATAFNLIGDGGVVFDEAIAKAGQQALNAAEKKAKEKKGAFNVSTKLLHGNPGNEIVKLAKTGKFDLIVVGNRGLSGVTGYVLGNVATNVVNNATVPVLVIK